MSTDYCKHMVPIMKNDTCHICSLEAEVERLRKELEEKESLAEKRMLEAQDWEDEYHALKRRYEELDKSALEKHELLMDTSAKFQAVSKELEEKEIILTGRKYTINRLKEQNEEIATMGIRQGERIARLLQLEKKQYKELERLRSALETTLFHLKKEYYMSAEDSIEEALAVGQEGEGNQVERQNGDPETQ